jgi:hypothetical protein
MAEEVQLGSVRDRSVVTGELPIERSAWAESPDGDDVGTLEVPAESFEQR